MVLHRLPLPIATLGDIEPLGLGLWAWCTRCKRERRVPISALLSVRPFAGARFRCSTCGAVGQASGTMHGQGHERELREPPSR